MSRLRPALAAAALVALVAASAHVRPEPTAREVVDHARRAHGVAVLDDACAILVFRGDTYYAARSNGGFTYRLLAAAREQALVTLTNDTLVVDTLAYEAYRKGKTMPFGYVFRDSVRANAASIVRAAETQLNSVIYFAFLPYNLNDPAVRLRRLDDATFDGRTHRTVEVTFAQENGGRDHDDRFVYWFDADSGLLRALAYRFHTGDGGTRFRRVSRIHQAEDRDALVRLNDYEAYTDTTIGDRIEAYPQHIGAATMQRLPDIALDSVRINLSVRRPDLCGTREANGI